MSGWSHLRDLARLVRAPAALTVPGDILAGAAAAGRPPAPAVLGTAASSVCLYWAGMALNDYADRELDAVERPERPIPSGAVTPRAALAVACGLTLAGVGLAVATDRRRALAITLPLTGAIWSYDLLLKATPAGPAAMAATRALNVLAGAGRIRNALPAAAIVALHTGSVTMLSRHETTGTGRAVPGAALAATCAVAAAAGLTGPGEHRSDRTAAALLAAAYVGGCGRAQIAAMRDPSAATVRQAVAAGIHSLMPLQAALTANAGSPAAALPIAAGYPLARWLGRKSSPT